MFQYDPYLLLFVSTSVYICMISMKQPHIGAALLSESVDVSAS